MKNSYYYVGFSSGGLERVGDWEFEKKLTRLAKSCNGDFSGSGYGFGARDYGFIFKTERSAMRFYSELGRRARSWDISRRFVNFTEDDNITTIIE